MGYLRDAEKGDMDLLFQWVNDSAVRKNSFSIADITYDEYVKWFEDMLSNDYVKQYIYIYNDEPAGQIRITINEQEAEIAYSISVVKRCMGLGNEMFILLAQKVQKDFPGVIKLTVKVKPDNIASQKTFLDMGYEQKYSAYQIAVDKAVKAAEYSPKKCGVLLLTNNCNALELYDWMREKYVMHLFSDRIHLQQIKQLQPDFIISYNYRYFICQDIIQYMRGKIINLHISYLPWNRGYSPNLWSFIDDTPKDVTIHQISPELDKGNILYQRQCYFDNNLETFASTYNKLNKEIVNLFKENCEEIISGKFVLKEQIGAGSFHTKKDFEILKESIEFDWNDNISEFLKRYELICTNRR